MHATERSNSSDKDELKKGLAVLAMEAALPSCAEARLSVAKDLALSEVISCLLREDQRGQEDIFFREIVTGSRTEGLTLEDGWGLDKADIDVMYLYDGAWMVHVPDVTSETPEEPYLELDSAYRTQAYSRVRVAGDRYALRVKLSHHIGRGRFRYRTAFGGGLLLGAAFLALTFMKSVIALVGIVLMIILLSMPPHICYFRREDAYRILLFIRQHLPFVYRHFMVWGIPTDNIAKAFQEHEEHSKNFYLSSDAVIGALGDLGVRPNKEGPSQVIDGDDYVPALLCDRPFATMMPYRRRLRGGWPGEGLVEVVTSLPGLLVPVGKKGSPLAAIEWRESYSMQEILLSRRMPAWVKKAYRAVKYSLKSLEERDEVSVCSVIKSSLLLRQLEKLADFIFSTVLQLDQELPYADVGGRSKICSYHIKTVLMWELEDHRAERKECSFQLMMDILRRLDRCLRERKIQNYFNPHCNLLENVSKEQIQTSRDSIRKILEDPLIYIPLCPLYPAQVYGDINPKDLAYYLTELSLIEEKGRFHQRANDFLETLRKLDKFRKKRYDAMVKKNDINDLQKAVRREDWLCLLNLADMMTELINLYGGGWNH